MTDKQQSIFFCLIVFLFASGAGLLVYKNYSEYYQQKAQIDLEAASTNIPSHRAAPASLADGRLQVDSPKSGATVGQAFTASGYAQGWFEGTIAIKVYDASSNLLYSGNTVTNGDNYAQPAPFSSAITLAATSTTQAGHIEFDDYSAKDGSLAYQKKVNINFSHYTQNGWQVYTNKQYGFSFNFPNNYSISEQAQPQSYFEEQIT